MIKAFYQINCKQNICECLDKHQLPVTIAFYATIRLTMQFKFTVLPKFNVRVSVPGLNFVQDDFVTVRVTAA